MPRSAVWPTLRYGDLERVHSIVEQVTPEMANAKIPGALFERQRPLRKSNILRLTNEMREDRFLPGTQIVFCVTPDNKERLVNGQHTLTCIIESDRPQWLTITYMRADNIEDVAQIYSVLDTQAVRTVGDACRAHGEEITSIPYFRQLASAVGIIENNMEQKVSIKGPASRAGRIALMKEYEVAARMFAGTIESGGHEPKSRILRAAIMAVALVTFQYQPSLAAEFWSGVADDEGLERRSPEKTLLTYLRDADRKKYQQAGGWLQRQMRVKAATLCWNAKFRNEELEFIKLNAFKRYRLLGTRFHHGLFDDETEMPDPIMSDEDSVAAYSTGS